MGQGQATTRGGRTADNPVEPQYVGERCQVDGVWKVTESQACLGWYNFHTDNNDKLMGTCNLQRGLLPLKTEVETLIWAMQCMLRHNKLTMKFETDCSNVVQMVSAPEDWLAFTLLLEEVNRCRRLFSSFSFVQIPRKENTKAKLYLLMCIM
ncbi:unnamed protein product [Microthlaspi erraticum]|uniref:RNase H type-1 domain-containing protein n=1 Tax=Microthlaspi erraticum TaxID=1685480 RepID=A0A6D2HPY0_9BRAS|nr:unnamed protein product [Microthlaspi erraticum]